MGKRVSKIFRGEIISSVFYLAFGLCLILIPDQTVNIICKIIFGLVMIAAGVYHIVIYAAEKEKATILDLFTGVIVMVLGVFLFFTPQIVIKILPYLLGAFVLVDSIWKIKGSYRLKKAERGRWKALFIGSVIFIVLGISMLFYFFLGVKKMILFSGIILAADGVADIVFLVMLRTGMRKAEKLQAAGEMEGTDYDRFTENKEIAVPEKEKPAGDESTDANTEIQTSELRLEEETVQTADAADADVVLEGQVNKTEEDVESPGREIREMLNNHDEPLEEWKD